MTAKQIASYESIQVSCCGSNYLKHTVVTIVALPLSFDCAVMFATLLTSAATLTLSTAPCSSIVNKGFLLFLISSALPPSTFCFSKPWFVVRSLQLEPAPSPASKPVADEKCMTVCLENLHLKCCCSSDAAPADGTASAAFIRPALCLTVGVLIRERGWEGVHYTHFNSIP